MTDYAAVLTALYPECVWSLNDNDLNTLTWDKSNADPKPTKAVLDAAAPQVAYDREYAQVRAARHAAYAAADGPDAIFLQWQRGDATEQDWLDAVQAVKDAHPYPPAPKKK
jgi:hypothetical protein